MATLQRKENPNKLSLWNRDLEKLIIFQLVKKFPVNGTWRFINMLTRAHPWTLSWATWIQSVLSNPSSVRSLLILSSHLCLCIPNSLCHSGFPTKILYSFFISHVYYMSCPSHPPWFDHPNIWWRVQIKKLLIMQSSPASCYFLLFRVKYSLLHPVLKHPQSMFLP
jgi:hypothetical protein